MVVHLLERRAAVNPPIPCFTPLMVAIRDGQKELMELLLEAKSDIVATAKTFLGERTALRVAMESFSADRPMGTFAIDLLIRRRADIYPRVPIGESPLASACGDAALLEHLVATHEVDLNWAAADGNTLLLHATRRNELAIMSALLARHADVNASAYSPGEAWHRDTPLGVACAGGHMDAVDLLLAANAYANQGSNATYDPPLLHAVRRNYHYVMRQLVAHQADVNMRNVRNITPLHGAIQNDQLRAVEQLLAWGADIHEDGVLSDGTTHILAACRQGDERILARLVEHKHGPRHACGVNIANKFGFTPLMIAARRGHLDCVELLLEHHADIGARNTWAQTAIMCAKDANQSDTVPCV